MSGNFSYESKLIAWQDTSAQQNPQQRVLDWHRYVTATSFDQASTRALQVGAGESLTLPIVAATGILAGNATWAVAKNSIKANTYRFTSVSALGGQSNLSGPTTVSFSTRTDGLWQVTLSAANLTLTSSTRRLFVPGAPTGDATSLFSDGNCGNWKVVSVSTDALTAVVSPLDGQTGVAESVLVTTTAVQSYPAVAADYGHYIYSNATDWAGVWLITGRTGQWFEVYRTTLPVVMPATVAADSGGNPTWYAAASWPKVVRVEADGVVEVAGLTTTLLPYSIIPFDGSVGWIEMAGSAVAPTPATVTNKGYATVNVNVFVIN